jgi:hypothetical protein
MKVVVAGSREFKDFAYLSEALDKLEITEVVCGLASADTLGFRYALMNDIDVKSFKPYWDTFGKRAGFIRNTEMGKYGDMAIVFWDGKSKGTGHMIDIMKKLKKPCIVKIYTEDEVEW